MERRTVRTKDGVALSYLTGGAGRPLIMLPGWSLPATIFQHQFDALCQIAQVIAVDMRGHGESEKPAHGYRIQRFSKDLFDLIEALGLVEPDILAHSLGASVTWSYLSLFGAERPPRRLVLIDEHPGILARADWTERDRAEAGSILPTLAALSDLKARARAADSPQAAAEMFRPMFSNTVSQEIVLQIARETLKLPRSFAAELLEDNCIQDWRSVIRQVRQPTLVVSGAASHVPPSSQRWIASVIPQARLEVFAADEGGRHFMFFENPARFNAIAAQFLAA